MVRLNTSQIIRTSGRRALVAALFALWCLTAAATDAADQRGEQIFSRAAQENEADRRSLNAPNNWSPVSYRFLVNGAMVFDKQTGLTWQRCSMLQEWKPGFGCDGAVDDRLDSRFALRHGGGTTWRVPTIDEMSTLFADKTAAPTFPAGNDLDLHSLLYASRQYCSSSTEDIDVSNNRDLMFMHPNAVISVGEGPLLFLPQSAPYQIVIPTTFYYECSIRLVRSDLHPVALQAAPAVRAIETPRFVARGAEIYDKVNKLTWMRCAIGQHWQEGFGCVGVIETFAWQAGQRRASGQWHIPTIEEWKAVLEFINDGSAGATSSASSTSSTTLLSETSQGNLSFWSQSIREVTTDHFDVLGVKDVWHVRDRKAEWGQTYQNAALRLVRDGPQGALEAPELAPPMKRAGLDCESLKQAIAEKLQVHGVKEYMLDIVNNGEPVRGRIVGRCAGGTAGIAYRKGPAILLRDQSPSRKAPMLAQVVVTRKGTLVVVGDGGAILRSTDGGGHWRPVASPAPAHTLTDVSALHNGVLVAVGDGVILRSIDDGLHWSASAEVGTQWYTLVRAGAKGAVIASGSDGVLEYSRDNGLHWQQAGTDHPVALTHAIRMGRHGLFAVGTWGGIVHSTDDGANWSIVANGSASLLRHIANLGRGVMIAVGDDGLILRSDDAGAHWATVDGGVQLGFTSILRTRKGSVLVAGGHGALLRSADDGASWLTIDSGTRLLLMDLLETKRGSLIAVGDDGVILRSVDDGVTWSSVGERSLDRWLLHVRATPDGDLIAVGDEGMILRSRDDGKSWHLVSGAGPVSDAPR